MEGPHPSRAARRQRAPIDEPAGFDFTRHIRLLAADMVARLPELAHIDLERVAIRFCQARKAVRHGIQASLTPLRFAGGARTTVRRGRIWTIQRVDDAAGREMLYLLSLYLPRFQELAWREKLATLLHELWHIGPAFDGDLRRHAGRCYAHSQSQRQYEAGIEVLLEQWLAHEPPAALHAFLRLGFNELERLHGPIYGLSLPTPRLIRVPATAVSGH